MKKCVLSFVCVALFFLLCRPVYAVYFSLDEKEAFTGMDGKSWYQGYEPTTKYNIMTICLPIRSDRAVGDITAGIALLDPDVFLLRSQPQSVTVASENGIYPVKLTLSLEPSRKSGDYPALITLTGQDEHGNPLEQTIPYVIRIRDGMPNPEPAQPVITQVSGQLNAGEDGSLTLTVTNPTATLSMTDPVLTVTESSATVLMSGSNRLALEEILPGESVEITVPMTVKASAAVEVHAFEFTLSYKTLGQSQTWTESFALPVNQQIRLELGGLDLATATQGELTTLTLPLMNMGRGQLQNAMVTMEIDGAVQRQSVLVGTLEPGETKQAKLTFTPGKEALGDYSGTVTVTCEDTYGNLSSQALSVALTVKEAAPVSDTTFQEITGWTPPGWLLPSLGSLVVLLIIALAAQGWLLRAKLHKLEEDRL